LMAERTFEEVSAELDAVILELGSGVPLARQAELFEKGTALADEADGLLASVERRVVIARPGGDVEVFPG
jgi:exodeoxyribonuclease VII small subunit